MSVYTKEEQFELIRKDPLNLEIIDNQYEEVCLEAVKQNGCALKYVKDQTEEMCLEAVKKFGLALFRVKEQTPEICLEAVKQNVDALKYVKDQTEQICLEAVKQDIYALQYVKEQTENICLEVVKNIGHYITNVKKKTPQLCFYAFLNDSELKEYKYIQNGISKFIKNNKSIKDKVFCSRCYNYINNGYYYFDLNSLKYLKKFLLKENSNNKYILDDTVEIDILKEIALSNNELILIDNGNIKDIHKILCNKIIKKEDLEIESF